MSNELAVIEKTEVDYFRTSTDAASLCKQIVLASAQDIKGKKYVKVEGWQAIAIAHGCTASARDVKRVETGFSAIGEVRRMSDGALISQAEGFVGDDESTWANRAEYAKRAMAQTRAISRACRSAFAHVVVMMNAGLSTTPAEEVPAEGFDHCPPQGAKPPIQQPQARQEAAVVGENTVISGVDSVTQKTGEKNGKAWTLYTVHAGEKYTTFDKTLAENAKKAHESGLMVEITFEQTEKGRNLKMLNMVEPRDIGQEG